MIRSGKLQCSTGAFHAILKQDNKARLLSNFINVFLLIHSCNAVEKIRITLLKERNLVFHTLDSLFACRYL